jgi:hypothetical protein
METPLNAGQDWKRVTMLWARDWRLEAVETAREKFWDQVQPPIARVRWKDPLSWA